MKPLLLGMARSDGKDGPALLPSGNGSAADRLLALSGMDGDEFLATFRRRNMIKGDYWTPQKAKIQGYRLRNELEGRVIVLGKAVWVALWLPRSAEFFSYVHTGKADFVLVPHPSGRNIVLNDRGMRQKMRAVLQGER